MSRTIMYAAKENGLLLQYAEFENAWRGAMWIWNSICRRRLGLHGMPMHDAKIWRKMEEAASESELLALHSTYDHVVADRDFMLVVADALEGFHDATENIRGQAFALRRAHEEGYRAVAWNQTSVNSNPWWVHGRDDEEDGHPYCLDEDKGHWFLGKQKDPYPAE